MARRTTKHRDGYVLMLTLGLMTLVAMSLASFARHSLTASLAATAAAEELQRRWGLLSTRHVLYDRASEIIAALVRAEEANTPPWPKPLLKQARFRLGSLEFTVVVADEGAKLNVNTICARESRQLGAILRRVNPSASRLRLRPIASKKSSAERFHSWGQVFDLSGGSNTKCPPAELVTLSRAVSCWGDGRLNLCRASDSAVRETASLVLSADDVGELITLRRTWGGGTIESLLAQLDLRRPQLAAASRLFTNESHNYSLWVEIDNGRRQWCYEYVDDGGPVGFAW